ncbi:MAG: hypothetical protein WBN07_11725 [Woeseiaceae bacterium]
MAIGLAVPFPNNEVVSPLLDGLANQRYAGSDAPPPANEFDLSIASRAR